MAEDYGLSAPPLLEIDLRAVFGRDSRHAMTSFLCLQYEDEFTFAAFSAIVIDGSLAARYSDIGTQVTR
jgi:hypothetical protein